MAKKKAVTKTKAPKSKSLFDHVNEVRWGKNPNYFDTLTDADKKTWSNYMVCRFLSMVPEWITTVHELQAYQSLPPEQFYTICIEVIPRSRGYAPYIKSSSEKYDKELLTLLCTHYEESERNVLEFLKVLTKDDLRNILSLYGYDEKAMSAIL